MLLLLPLVLLDVQTSHRLTKRLETPLWAELWPLRGAFCNAGHPKFVPIACRYASFLLGGERGLARAGGEKAAAHASNQWELLLFHGFASHCFFHIY